MLCKAKTTVYDRMPKVSSSITVNFSSATTIYNSIPPFSANGKAIFRLRLKITNFSTNTRNEIVIENNGKLYKGQYGPIDSTTYNQWLDLSFPFDYVVGNVKITLTPSNTANYSVSGTYYINYIYGQDTHQLKPIVLNNIGEFNTPYSFGRLPTGERRDGN